MAVTMHSDFEDEKPRVVTRKVGPRTLAAALGFPGWEVRYLVQTDPNGDYSVTMQEIE